MRATPYILGISILWTAVSNAGMYSYQDEEGNIHITDTPPNDQYQIVLSSLKTPKGFQKPVKTGSHFSNMLNQAAHRAGLPFELVLAIIKTESNFNPQAISTKGAKGLMQLMPQVCQDFGVDNPFNADQNVFAGTSYFKQMLSQFKTIPLALAAYNAGPGNVNKYNGIPPFQETHNYIKKVLWYQNFYENKLDLLKLPKSADAFETGIQSFENGNYNQAFQNFARVLKNYPNSPEANFNYALVNARFGYTDHALDLYQQALICDPYFKEAYYNLSILLEKNNQIQQAVTTWKNYLKFEIDPISQKKVRLYIHELMLILRKE